MLGKGGEDGLCFWRHHHLHHLGVEAGWKRGARAWLRNVRGEEGEDSVQRGVMQQNVTSGKHA